MGRGVSILHDREEEEEEPQLQQVTKKRKPASSVGQTSTTPNTRQRSNN